MSQVRFGANYVPSKYWYYTWMDWDHDSIQQDLETLSAMGLDHIRTFLLWPYFQPNANFVSPNALRNLEDLMDMAHRVHLQVIPSVLTGWASGFAYLPAWLMRRNLFTCRDVINAEKRLFSAIAEAVGDHPAFLGFDLGNEINVLSGFGQDITVQEGDRWTAEMMEHLEAITPGKVHVNGIDHMPFFMNTGFSRAQHSSLGSMTSVHGWIRFTGALDMYGPGAPEINHLASFCLELANAYGDHPDRDIWLQEFGSCAHWMREEDLGTFTRESVRQALTCQNLWGITWWCSHDVSEVYEEFDRLEYKLGLIDIHNHIKPMGKAYSEVIAEYKRNPLPPVQRSTALILPDNLYDGSEDPRNRGREYIAWKIGRPFMKLAVSGQTPAIVLESRSRDDSYLKARSIKRLISLDQAQ